MRLVYCSPEPATKISAPEGFEVSQVQTDKVGIEAILHCQAMLELEVTDTPIWWVMLHEGEKLSSTNIQVLKNVSELQTLDILTATTCAGVVPRVFRFVKESPLFWDEAKDGLTTHDNRQLKVATLPDPLETIDSTKLRLISASCSVLAKAFDKAPNPELQAKLALGIALMHHTLGQPDERISWLRIAANSTAPRSADSAKAILELITAIPEMPKEEQIALLLEAHAKFPVQTCSFYEIAKIYLAAEDWESATSWASAAVGLGSLTRVAGHPLFRNPEADFDGPLEILKQTVPKIGLAQLEPQTEEARKHMRALRAKLVGDVVATPLILL